MASTDVFDLQDECTPVVACVDIPTDKAGLCLWLNTCFNTDNG